MDFGKNHRPHVSRIADSSFRRDVIQLTCAGKGHTYIYSFAPEDAGDAAAMVCLHVEEKILPRSAGKMLCKVIGEMLYDE